MESDFLSDIELYFTEPENVQGKNLTIFGEECRHIQKVMRHETGDELFVTNGGGLIHKTQISSISKNEITCNFLKTFRYKNTFKNLVVCIPRLKSQDRFEFALEKCIELGITNFIIFDAERSVAKGPKIERWNKIALAAMKQSLRSYLPVIEYEKSLKNILARAGVKIYFDQNADKKLSDSISGIMTGEKTYIIFGPEGGLAEKEIEMLKECKSYQLTENRLRAETAVIAAVSLIVNL